MNSTLQTFLVLNLTPVVFKEDYNNHGVSFYTKIKETHHLHKRINVFKHLTMLNCYTAKKGSQIRTLKIVTLIEHLKVFCLHTPSVLDFNTI